MRFDEYFIQNTLSKVIILGNTIPTDPHVVIDSRLIKPGDIFVALLGERQDGHDFILEAIKKGACCIILREDKRDVIDSLNAVTKKKVTFLLVPNTLEALTTLAAAWRAQFNNPVIGITGSVGKTSTKQLLANILQNAQKNFLISRGNQNTLIGMSLNILRLRSEHEGAIFEVGINKRGEMARLADVLRPTSAVITNVGHCHMEGLGSLQDIALEKRELFSYFSENSIGIINGDQSILSQVSYNHPVIKFGTKTTNQIQARKIHIKGSQTTFLLKIYNKKFSITVNHPHSGIIMNALAATATAYFLDIPSDPIIKAIQLPMSVTGRFESRPLKDVKGTIIHDSYNANPESMKAALLAFEHLKTNGQKIAIIGDMLELGVNSPFWHRQIGRFLRKVPSLDKLILVGSLVGWVKKTTPMGIAVDHVSSWQEAIDKVKDSLSKDSLILVKGSRAMGLNNLVNSFSQL